MVLFGPKDFEHHGCEVKWHEAGQKFYVIRKEDSAFLGTAYSKGDAKKLIDRKLK